MSVTIDGTSTLNNVGQSTTFQVTGGGADFNLSPAVSLAGKVSIGFETVTTGNLGLGTDNYLSALAARGFQDENVVTLLSVHCQRPAAKKGFVIRMC